MQIFADWDLYELILFNIIQNSVKYNQLYDGEIAIVISCKPMKIRFENVKNVIQDPYLEDKNYILETRVIDTGLGIAPERQKFLFRPFNELKDALGVKKS